MKKSTKREPLPDELQNEGNQAPDNRVNIVSTMSEYTVNDGKIKNIYIIL